MLVLSIPCCPSIKRTLLGVLWFKHPARAILFVQSPIPTCTGRTLDARHMGKSSFVSYTHGVLESVAGAGQMGLATE